MEPTPESIIDFAAQRAREVWEEKREPYLLALLSPELRARNIDYKIALGTLRLKEFFQTHGTDKVKLVFHRDQKSKIGLVPHNEEFSYPDHERDSASTSEISGPLRPGNALVASSSARFVVMRFLQLLAELPKEEIEKVNIPVSVLSMLVKAR